MRAAVLESYDATPQAGDRPEPVAGDGKAVVELLAAALNPADLTIASGTFPAGSPPLPYVPGIEGVGRVVESARFAPGTRVWASGRGLGVAADGSFSDRFAVAEEALFPVPDEAGDAVAAAFGQVGVAAWMPLTWLAPVRDGETVLVLGATGNVGTVAVQAAKLLGAGRVVAVGRDEGRLAAVARLGADATVALGGDDFHDRLASACTGAPPTLVVDMLWAEPVEAAAAVAGAGARFVHLGQSAGPSATFASGLVRGKQLQILGYSNFAVPPEVLARGYAEIVGHAAAGRIRLTTRTVPLDRVGEAWEQQRSRRDAKTVVVPGTSRDATL
jgi:NADPH:quinone reductase-like Zn-dependent oxidoreductase